MKAMALAKMDRVGGSGATSQFTLLLVAQVLSALLQALAVLLLARWTSPAEFGYFAVILATMGIAAALGDFGLATLATRRRASDAEDPTIGRLLAAGKMSSLAFGLIALTVFATLSPGSIGEPIVVLLAAYSVVDRWLQMELGISIADGRVWVNLVSLAVARGLLLAGMLFGESALGLSAGMAYSTSAFAASLIAYITAKHLTARYAAFKSFIGIGEDLRESLSFWIATVSAMVRTLDVVVLAYVGSPASAGMYAVPARISAPLRLLPLTINRMAIPYGSRGDQAMLSDLRRVMRVIFWVMTVVYCGIFVYAEPLIDALVGDKYGAAVAPFQILLVGLLFNLPGSFKSGLLQGAGHQRIVARLGVLLAAACLILVAALGAVWGAIGAAAAVTSVYVLQYVATTWIFAILRKAPAT
jgi:O-antigen/teichoic acid export membrane protein